MAMAVSQINTWEQHAVLTIEFIATTGYYEIIIAIIINVYPAGVHIFECAVLFQIGLWYPVEFPCFILKQYNAFFPFRGAEEEVLQTVLIDVPYGKGGTFR